MKDKYMVYDDEPFIAINKDEFDECMENGQRVQCPCCNKVYNTVYRRKVYKGMLQALKLLYRRNESASANNFGDFTKLKHFGLVIQTNEGYWFVTKLGEDFIHGKVTIPKYVYLLNNNVEGYSEEEIFFNDI